MGIADRDRPGRPYGRVFRRRYAGRSTTVRARAGHRGIDRLRVHPRAAGLRHRNPRDGARRCRRYQDRQPDVRLRHHVLSGRLLRRLFAVRDPVAAALDAILRRRVRRRLCDLNRRKHRGNPRHYLFPHSGVRYPDNHFYAGRGRHRLRCRARRLPRPRRHAGGAGGARGARGVVVRRPAGARRGGVRSRHPACPGGRTIRPSTS
jgi:hypothetical protein